MNETKPIRDLEKLREIKQCLKETSNRDYLLFLAGIYTGLRMIDITSLTVADVKGTHIEISEKETGKAQRILVHQELRKALDAYTAEKSDNERLFEQDAAEGFERALTSAAVRFGLGRVGAETLRKTWGYQIYQQADPADRSLLLTSLSVFFSHKNALETMDYLQIVTQEDIDRAMNDFEL